jgi:hypothetical protein
MLDTINCPDWDETAGICKKSELNRPCEECVPESAKEREWRSNLLDYHPGLDPKDVCSFSLVI